MAQAPAAGVVGAQYKRVAGMKNTSALVHRLSAVAAILAMLGIALGLACATTQNPPDTTPANGAADPPSAATEQAGEAGVSGVFDDYVLFGQSAAFTGPAGELGNSMRTGILAAFNEVNAEGGVHGRELRLESLNDSYEADFAFSNTRDLIDKAGVFALIGAVGTPTARAATPQAHVAGVPYIAPFTGAAFLRDPYLDNVLNLRASYYQETDEMVARLTEDLGITKIAVMYQDDSYGRDGLEGVLLALQRRDMQPVVSWHYPRNTIAVKAATLRIAEAHPEAVIMIGAYAPVARAIELLRRDIDPVFMTVSFVGSNALAEELGAAGEGVYVTQVVPLPQDGDIPVVARYHAALAAYDPDAEPGFVSLEGYLAGRLAVAGLQACGRELTRKCFLDGAHNVGTIDIDGFRLLYEPEDDNQGSDTVFITVIGADGEYHQVDKLGGSN